MELTEVLQLESREIRACMSAGIHTIDALREALALDNDHTPLRFVRRIGVKTIDSIRAKLAQYDTAPEPETKPETKPEPLKWTLTMEPMCLRTNKGDCYPLKARTQWLDHVSYRGGNAEVKMYADGRIEMFFNNKRVGGCTK